MDECLAHKVDAGPLPKRDSAFLLGVDRRQVKTSLIRSARSLYSFQYTSVHIVNLHLTSPHMCQLQCSWLKCVEISLVLSLSTGISSPGYSGVQNLLEIFRKLDFLANTDCAVSVDNKIAKVDGPRDNDGNLLAMLLTLLYSLFTVIISPFSPKMMH
uniref:Uncharacterized protein n=1 Tax=Glossina austeni TaxID=7395 RepID=A0A1A9UPY7_GLOAU